MECEAEREKEWDLDTKLQTKFICGRQQSFSYACHRNEQREYVNWVFAYFDKCFRILLCYDGLSCVFHDIVNFLELYHYVNTQITEIMVFILWRQYKNQWACENVMKHKILIQIKLWPYYFININTKLTLFLKLKKFDYLILKYAHSIYSFNGWAQKQLTL